jgi:broad specificity phosphatase PhoE
MVGLPARGKTFMSKKLTSYLSWIGIETRIFNVGEYRRKATSASAQNIVPNKDFFDPENKECVKIRAASAKNALEDMCEWLSGDNTAKIMCGIFDATNSTRDRRKLISNYCQHNKFHLFFVESICDSVKQIEKNIKSDKIKSIDYVDVTSVKEAKEDFLQRIHFYEMQYEPIDQIQDKHQSFIKVINTGEKFIVNLINTRIQSLVVYFLMNIKFNSSRTIYLTRHGETDMNQEQRIGGNGSLTAKGQKYAQKLGEYFKKDNERHPNGMMIWTSQYQRTIQTAEKIDLPQNDREQFHALNEINAGICEGMTYQEIEDLYPQELAKRDGDKYYYRYPKGESYEDLVKRLEPIIMQLESMEESQRVLIVCHQAVIRCLLAYFLNKTHEELPYLEVPLHTLIKLTPHSYGCHVKEIKFDIDCVSTYRQRPTDFTR